MSDAALPARSTRAGMGRLFPRIRSVVLLAAACLAGALAAPSGALALGLFAAALTFALFAGIALQAARRAAARDAHLAEAGAALIDSDPLPALVTDADGAVVALNGPARRRFDAGAATTLADMLKDRVAEPGTLTFRLRGRAEARGGAEETVLTRGGQMRLVVQRLGADRFLWRLDELADRAQGARGADGLALPMLTVGRSGAILYMNPAARRLIGSRVKALDRLFARLPVVPGEVQRVSTETGSVACMVAEAEAVGGRRELFLLPAPDGRADAGEALAVFDDLPVPLLKVAADGSVQKSNRLARALVGVDAPEGHRLSDLMEGLGRPVADWLDAAVSGHGLQHSEFLRLTRGDKEVFVQVTLNRVSEDGHPVLIAVLNDATELKTLEAQFVQSQKMQAIGQLAGGVAHDFNNLLTAISGHCDLLLLRHDQGDPDYADLVQINQNANRAAALVGQLLAFSRKQTLRPEVLDVRDTLSDLTHLLNRLVGERVMLTLNHDPVLGAIRADKRQLEQVIMNLVVNARDAMPEGGEITIETRDLDLAEPLRRDRATVAPGRYVSVKVTDQGTGIPADKLQKVFEPFYTTKRTGEGTGLGLSTAYGIVKQTGGFIFVDSMPGMGTSFTLLFPVTDRVEPAPPPAVQAEAAPPPRPGDGVVLLVEDEAPVRAFASRALRLRGYTVLEADSAEEALKTLEDPALCVDVFVTDVVMPGMDGPSWVQEALKARPGVRVVFVSGYAEESFGDAQAQIPNSVFLPKPFSLSDLTETVQRQLH